MLVEEIFNRKSKRFKKLMFRTENSKYLKIREMM